MAYDQHQSSAAPVVARVAVITLSDTRTQETDHSGQTIRELLADAGHEVRRYEVIREEPAQLTSLLRSLISDSQLDVILTNGGTGVSRRDQSIDVIAEIIERPLPGFGELFRMLSWEQVGSGAMLSRAVAGMVGGTLIFAMPGSTKAVELAMTRLILPELKHLLHELRK